MSAPARAGAAPLRAADSPCLRERAARASTGRQSAAPRLRARKRPSAVDPALRVDRPVPEPERRGARARTCSATAPWSGPDSARRRDVDRLFENGPIERVRLVENRERLQRAARQHPFQRELRAVDVLLDEDFVLEPGACRRGSPARASSARDALERGRRIPAGLLARMTPRLPESRAASDTQRKQDVRSCPAGRSIGIHSGMRPEPRRRQPRRRERALARGVCRARQRASAGCHGRPSASAARAARTTGRSPTAMTPSNGRSAARASTIARTEPVDVVEPHRNRAVLPRIVQRLHRSVAKTSSTPSRLRRVIECAQLVAGRVTQEKQSRQLPNLQPPT